VVVFSLGLGGVPEGGPVAGQLSGTLCVSQCAGLTHLISVCRADPSHVARPCFEFQGSITFPLSNVSGIIRKVSGVVKTVLWGEIAPFCEGSCKNSFIIIIFCP
jgi:hypothetical protein